MSDRGAGSQSCMGSISVGTESKAKPGQASRRQGDTPAPSFSCCLTQFPSQRCCQGQILLLLCSPSPRAHHTPVPSSMDTQALPLQR